MWYGIWCKDKTGGYWLDDGTIREDKPVYAYRNKRIACRVAAELFGYSTYSQAKADGWVEVRKLNEE